MKSKTSVDVSFLERYLSRQLDSLFPDLEGKSLGVPLEVFQGALDRANFCISRIRVFSEIGFNYTNSGNYAIFLYYLSHLTWKVAGNSFDAARLFSLNKALNGIDLYYEIEMPSVFAVAHTVGMVFAKAHYGNYCIFYQGATVGRDGDYRPVLEEGVVLYPNSSVIGRCHVRTNTVLTPGVQLINTDTPGNCLVFPGPNGRPVFKEAAEVHVDRYLLRDI